MRFYYSPPFTRVLNTYQRDMWTTKNKLDEKSENTLLFAKAGLINNPNICIKGMTTCACVCKTCTEQFRKDSEELYKYLDEILLKD